MSIPGIYIHVRRLEHVHTHTHHYIHRIQSSCNSKEYFFRSSTETLLEAVLSDIPHKENTGAQVPSQAVLTMTASEMWHQGPGCPVVLVFKSRG